jgi:hypothetical protein
MRAILGLLVTLAMVLAWCSGAAVMAANPGHVPTVAAFALVGSSGYFAWRLARTAWRRPSRTQRTPLVGMRPRFGVLSTGELTIEDLLAAKHLSFARYGRENIIETLARDMAAWNLFVRELVTEVCEVQSEDRQRIYGASTNNQMVKVSVKGRAPTQRPATESETAYPLEKFQYNLGWDKDWFLQHTPADMAKEQQAGQKAHLRRLYGAITQAIFSATNFTFVDYTVDNISFSIKRFLNADGWSIPDGPHGETFNPATHTHYVATNGYTAAGIIALGNNVLEHRISPDVVIAINANDAATVLALTGFVSALDANVRMQYGSGQFTVIPLDTTQLTNRMIGRIGGFPVWTKPWVPVGYACAYDIGATEKPLVLRCRKGMGGPDLEQVQSIDSNPLHIEYLESYLGVGAYGRMSAAAYYTAGGGTVWADASIVGA